MTENLFKGQLVRLSAEEPQVIAESFVRWQRDSEFHRLLTSSPAGITSIPRVTEWVEKMLNERKERNFYFGIRTLEDDRLIGDMALEINLWSHGYTYVGIGLGEREDWGKGYGTDAMRILLRYAFNELNLPRVTLDVFEYNPRAIRSYEKVGFVHEGRVRQLLLREGRRWDLIYMGITRQDWLANQANASELKE